MSINKVEKRKNFIINIIFLAIVLALAFLFVEYAIKWVMPFIIGFLVSFAFRPVIRLLENKCKINKRVGAFLVILIGYGLLGFLVWLIGDALFDGIKEFCLNIPNLYTQEIAPFLGEANKGFLRFAERFSPEIAAQAEQVLSDVLTNIQVSLVEISANVLSTLAGASTKVPFFFISLIFTILSSLFISMDYDHVMDFIMRQIPDKHKEMIIDIKSYLGKTLVGYLRAYLILMSITFVELSVGFLALRVNNPFGIAAITAIADALPILGTGTVVLPWAVISLFQQRFYLALGLVLLYLIITAVRQFIEPKIVGDQLGLPPIVSIICIYLGYIWFGLLGVILIPVTVNILFSLHRAGKIHIWK